MHWIDWIIVTVPVVVVLVIGLRAQRYVNDVSDFLAAGRVAGRYVLCVAIGTAGMGLISLVGQFEFYYNSGFAVGFWNQLTVPLGLVLTLTGFCYYRYRETRAMTLGQFFEIRYSKSFRIFAAILMTISGVINYAIFPAVGARCLMYFCDLPTQVDLLGMTFPTFGLVMLLFLGVAVLIVNLGGQITVITTDCIQGILSYPLYLIIVAYIMYKFSWSNEMAPALMDREPGKSMLNPFDVHFLRDFNLFYVLVNFLGYALNIMSWQGSQGYNASAMTPHEQKMGAVLGNWRTGFSTMMFILLAVAAYTFLNHKVYSDGAREVRRELATKALHDVAADETLDDFRADAVNFLDSGIVSPAIQERLDAAIAAEEAEKKKEKEIRRALAIAAGEEFEDEPTEPEPQGGQVERVDPEAQFNTVYSALKAEPNGKAKAQTLQTIYTQMRVPMTLKHIFPVGITGILCALMIFLLITTDTTYMHSWGTIIIQDLVLPFRKKPFTPKQQLNCLRLSIGGVAAFAFMFSFLFQQNMYILMFFAITGAIWLGGAGPCILFGLYWKRGTTAAAYAALISGSSISVAGWFGGNYWVEHIYPWLVETGHITWVRTFLESVSRPLNPIIEWNVTGDRFPINAQEIWAITMIISLGLYFIISKLSRKEPFNMERMLHRGKYHVEGSVVHRPKWKWSRLLGIDDQYTKGDKILAWSVFLYSMIHGFGFFLVILIWNAIDPWPKSWWSHWFFIYNVVIAAIIGIVSTIWFSIGTTVDLRRMFKRLAAKTADLQDDGRVIGHISTGAIDLVERVEHRHITEKTEEDDKHR